MEMAFPREIEREIVRLGIPTDFDYIILSKGGELAWRAGIPIENVYFTEQ